MRQFRPTYLYNGTETRIDSGALNLAQSSSAETVLPREDSYLYICCNDSPMDFLYFYLDETQDDKEGIEMQIGYQTSDEMGEVATDAADTTWIDIYDNFDDVYKEENEDPIKQFDFRCEGPIYIAEPSWRDWKKSTFNGKTGFWLRIKWRDPSAVADGYTPPKTTGLLARRVESYCRVKDVSRYVQFPRSRSDESDFSETSYPSIADVRRLIWQAQGDIDQITHRQWRPTFVYRESHDFLNEKLIYPLSVSGPLKLTEAKMFNRGSIIDVDIGRDEEVFLDKGGEYAQLVLPLYFYNTAVPKVFLRHVIKNYENLVFKMSYLACEPPFSDDYGKVTLLTQLKVALNILQSYNQQSLSGASTEGQVTITGLVDRYERMIRDLQGELMRTVML